ncbi:MULTISPECIES: hypothetical protein [unclassified Microbacterium]|uniref:hypothetical protein n=1 Tax=unclassified Microbacterium TaxID=2609290 RepID=UPI0022F0DCF3|nr:hypothetical protein [Streptomyces sp. MS2A]
MDVHPYLSYRVTTLEIEEAARRAERARMAAEHADQILTTERFGTRLRRWLGRDSAVRRPAGREAAPGAPVSPRASAVRAASSRPAAPASDPRAVSRSTPARTSDHIAGAAAPAAAVAGSGAFTAGSEASAESSERVPCGVGAA